MGLSLLVLIVLPLVEYSPLQCIYVRIYFYFWFWFFVTNLVVISWLGAQVAQDPFYIFSKISVLNFFVDIFIIVPFINKIEMETIGLGVQD